MNNDVMEDAMDGAIPDSIRKILPQTLTRLAEGLPRHELDLICKEATACEFALKKEIEKLEAELNVLDGKPDSKPAAEETSDENKDNFGLQEPTMISIPQLPLPYQPAGGGPGGVGNKNYLSSVDEILNTEFTPPDRYFTVSALLGRLKDPLKMPLHPNRVLKVEETEQMIKKRKIVLDKQQALLELEKNPVYDKEHADNTILLNLWKRISSNKTAAVFRKPVNPAEAPGYTERICFPIDLSLIRKFIVSRKIKSYKALHQRIGLVCHNCVKFNGRESDYAIITREFEDLVDDKILEAVRTATEAAASTAAASSKIPQTAIV